MKNLFMILVLMFSFPAFAADFEAEDQPITSAQHEAQQKSAKASKHKAVPSAGDLRNSAKKGDRYSMMLLGGGIIKLKCGNDPTPGCRSQYISRQTGFSKREGSGAYYIECFKEKTCMAVNNAAENGEDSAVDAVIYFDRIIEITDNNGNVKRLPVIVIDEIE